MNIIKPLDSSSAYIYCPTCRDNGTPNSMLSRDMHTVKCQFGHQWDMSSFARLLAQRPVMAQMDEILTEQPNPLAMAWKIMVLPETRTAFEAKFKNRVHITIGTFLAALCEDSLLILSGGDVLKLRAKGITTSAQVIAALEGVEQLERDRTAAVGQLEKLMNTLRAVQGGGDGT